MQTTWMKTKYMFLIDHNITYFSALMPFLALANCDERIRLVTFYMEFKDIGSIYLGPLSSSKQNFHMLLANGCSNACHRVHIPIT